MSEDENEEGLGDDWGAAMQEQGDAEAGADADWGDALKEQGDAEVMESAQFNELETQDEVKSSNADMSTADLKLDVILDVPVTVSMEIGRTNINSRNLLFLFICTSI